MSWIGRLVGQRPAGAPADRRHRLAAAGAVRASVHGDGMALLNISTGKVFLCNETGSLIWQGIAAGLSPEAICAEMSREFGVAEDLVRRQTSPFLYELERRGLVVRQAEC